MNNNFNPRTDDWAQIGFTIAREAVATQAGPNKTSRVTLNRQAFIPIPTNLDTITETFGAEMVLACLNGTSLRVQFQDVNRRLLATPATDGDILAALYDRLRGVKVRGTGAVKVVVKVRLPDGSLFEGDDVDNFRRAFANALERLGMARDVAEATAASQSL